MNILSIWMAQRNLHRSDQIPGLIAAIREDQEIEPVILNRDEDGSVQVQDGHHRLAAIWLSGKTTLEKHHYRLLEKDHWRPKCGKITDLVGMVHKDAHSI